MTIHRLVQLRSAITRTLWAMAALVVLASVGGQLAKYWLGYDDPLGLVPLFYVAKEKNIPTLFSAFLLFSAASLLALIAVDEKRRAGRDASKWTVLAVGFLYMTVDECVRLHEMLIAPGRALLGGSNLGIFYYAWVIPGAAVVLVLGVFFLGFLRRLPARTRVAFITAATLFVGGAIGVELFEGRYSELYGSRNLTFSMYATVEEGLEMAGVILFIHALLQYIAEHCNHDYALGPLVLLNRIRSALSAWSPLAPTSPPPASSAPPAPRQ